MEQQQLICRPLKSDECLTEAEINLRDIFFASVENICEDNPCLTAFEFQMIVTETIHAIAGRLELDETKIRTFLARYWRPHTQKAGVWM